MSKTITRVQPQKERGKPGYIAYYRVSTQKQGESGLGLEAQRQAVQHLAKNAPIVAEYTEIESGKRHENRPQLTAAIEESKRLGATLLIAKLDRLTRNVHFISGLMDADVDFRAADAPYANRLTIHIMAAFAEHEARAISDRTKAALGALKARGVKLGNSKWKESLEKARQARIRCRAPAATPMVQMMERERIEGGSYRAIAERLNELGLKTPGGKHWYASTVRTAMRRATAA
jgi:DNA invertase Pin-like site-specific DNA recombinase